MYPSPIVGHLHYDSAFTAIVAGNIRINHG